MEWDAIVQNAGRNVTGAHSDWVNANGGNADIFREKMEKECEWLTTSGTWEEMISEADD